MSLVHRDTADGVATITLDSPANRNALSAQLRRELHTELTAAVDDDAARVLVLTHTGTVFCAGMDLKESPAEGIREFPAILEAIWHSPKPVVARLAGPARAGGVGLVAACDLAIAADTCSFAFTEVRLGVVPAVISATVLRRVLPHAAAELFLTGESFDAAHAAAIGLLTRAVPAEQLDAEVARFVRMLILGAPGALAATKTLLRRSRPAEITDDLAAMNELSAAFFGSDEGQEGIRAFREKRVPAWAEGGRR